MRHLKSFHIKKYLQQTAEANLEKRRVFCFNKRNEASIAIMKKREVMS